VLMRGLALSVARPVNQYSRLQDTSSKLNWLAHPVNVNLEFAPAQGREV